MEIIDRCRLDLRSIFFFSENRAVYETMWKSTVQPDRPQTTIQR